MRAWITPRRRAGHSGHAGFTRGGTVDNEANGFDPSVIVRDFDWGRSRTLPDGRTLREWHLYAIDKAIEIAPGVQYAAWTFNGRVPGPDAACTEGDQLRIRFTNGCAHPTRSTSTASTRRPWTACRAGEEIGGGLIEPGESFVYEFEAEPFGLHLYHCHAEPLAAHIAKGMYGTFIDRPEGAGRAEADELVMVQAGSTRTSTSRNELYSVNTVGFHYLHEPDQGEARRARADLPRQRARVRPDQLVPPARATSSTTSRPGRRCEPIEYTDTISQVQGQRGILELRFPYLGKYMFHAHKTEFAELGWMGFFEVVD